MENFEDIKLKYNELVDFLIKYFPQNEELKNVSRIDDSIMQYVNNFVNGVNRKTKYQTMLVERNVNMFHKKTHEYYISILPEINIKKFLLTNDDYVKHIVWEYLQLIYLLAESYKQEKWHKMLIFKIENTECPPITEPPNPFDNMINDITSSFMNAFDGNDVNPLSAIMKTSMEIMTKHKDTLTNNTLDISQIIKSFSRTLGQDENELQKVIDSNPLLQKLADAQSNPEQLLGELSGQIGINPDDLQNNNLPSVLGKLMGENGNFNNILSGVMSSVGSGEGGLGGLLSGGLGKLFGGDKQVNISELTEEQIKELEEFYKNNTQEFEKFLLGNTKN